VILPPDASSGEVRLTATGLPQGASARFTPNPTTNRSTLTVRITNDAKPATYPVIIHGVSSGLTWNTTVTLTVQ